MSRHNATDAVEIRHQGEVLGTSLPPLMIEAERIAETVAQGIHGRRRVGPGETFWQYRRFHQGDSRTIIDWRKSAKSDHLFVRELEWEAAQSIWFWRDTSRSMSFQSEFADTSKQRRASVLCIALASLLARGGERVAATDQPHRPSASRLALSRLATHFSDQSTKEMVLPDPAAFPRHGTIVMMSDFLGDADEIAATISALAAHGLKGHMLMIADPAEEDLPYEGRTEFLDLDGKSSLIFGRAESARTAYRARYESHREVLRQTARALGWTFFTHRTDHPATLSLLSLYSALTQDERK